MPGKRKATTKSVDKKEEKEVEHKTKATKKTKADEEEDMEEEVETTSKRASSRSKSKDTKAADSKEKKSPQKGKAAKKDKEEEEDDDDDDEEEEPQIKKKVGRGKKESAAETKAKTEKMETEKPKKTAKGKGKKEEDDEEEEEKETKKADTKKAAKESKPAASTNGKGKLNRNRSDLVDTVADEIENPVFDLGDGKIPEKEIIISSWNVAGMQSIVKKATLQSYLKERNPHILCINETKLTPETLKSVGTAWVPEGYTSYFNNCKTKKGYSGTAIITKYKPQGVNFGIGIKKHDLEGRTITLEFEHFYLISCYVPNAGEKLVGLDYRTKEWDLDFSDYLNKLKAKKHVILCGDLNVAHKDIDIYETKGKHKFAGFTPEERKGFGDFLETGFVDTFRHLHPEDQTFSYFSARFPQMKTENRGWRLDYFVIDKEGLSGVKDSLINGKITGSDHVPIELLLNPSFK